jgi:hypothetical protein
MSAALAVPAPSTTQRSLLRQLALIHTQRFACHPLFLAGLAGLVIEAGAVLNDPQTYQSVSGNVAPAVLVGFVGLIVAYRLSRDEEAAIAVLPSAPVGSTTRTLALVAACSLPAAVGTVWAAVQLAVWSVNHLDPVVVDAHGWPDIVAIAIAGSAVACFGGPVLGVVVARWTRFPGAGVLAGVLVMLLTGLGLGIAMTFPGTTPAHWFANGLPWTMWELDDGGIFGGLRPGHPIGHLVYAIGLCGLGVAAAVVKDAEGDDRTTWMRRGAWFGAITVAGAIVTGPW